MLKWTCLTQADIHLSQKPLCLYSAVHAWRPRAEVTPAVFSRLRGGGEGQGVWGQAQEAQMDSKHGWGRPSGLLHLLPHLPPPERGFEIVYPNPLTLQMRKLRPSDRDYTKVTQQVSGKARPEIQVSQLPVPLLPLPLVFPPGAQWELPKGSLTHQPGPLAQDDEVVST